MRARRWIDEQLDREDGLDISSFPSLGKGTVEEIQRAKWHCMHAWTLMVFF